jgi:diguanylate cyclase (GGDEF)-like protein
VADALAQHADRIVTDAARTVVLDDAAAVELAERQRIGHLTLSLLGGEIRDDQAGTHRDVVAALHRALDERDITIQRFFAFAYVIERMALDELAVTEGVGATTESWPLVSQLVRRASFDILAAFASTSSARGPLAILDRLTTLHTRAVFDTALAKELDRAGRMGQAVSMILIDVDELSALNAAAGLSIGDRILEQLGVLTRGFFRQHDWVARYRDDSIAVLLSDTTAKSAATLAECVREAVEDRLSFVDHRTGSKVTVTVSAGAVTVALSPGQMIDPDRLATAAEGTLRRAKERGRNRVESTTLTGPTLRALRSPPSAS